DRFRGVKILDADRRALERTRLFLAQARVAGARHFKRLVRGDGDKRVEPPGVLDRLEMGSGHLEARNRPGLETIARFGERERGQIGQTGILGRRASRRGGSLNHFGNDKEAVLAPRRIGEHLRGNIAVGDDILAHRQPHGNDRGHRLDAVDIDRVEGLDELENRVNLTLQVRRLSFAHLNAREMRDAADGVEIDGHPKLPKPKEKRERPYTSPIFGWQTSHARPARDMPGYDGRFRRRLARGPVIARLSRCAPRSRSKISPSAFLPKAAWPASTSGPRPSALQSPTSNAASPRLSRLCRAAHS